MTGTDGNALAPYRLSGTAMLPLDWFARAMGLTTTWEGKRVTLTANEDELAQLSIDGDAMQVGDKSIPLSVPVTETDGVAYVPARAMCEALGWSIASPADTGAYIFIDNGSKAHEPTAQQLANAREKLGPAVEEVLSNSLIARVGAGTLAWNGADQELQTEDQQNLGVIAQEGVYYLPVEAAMAAIGGTATPEGDSCTLTLDAQTVTVQGARIDGKSIEGLTAEMFTDAEGVAYIPAELLAAALGLQYTALPGDVFALTAEPLAGHASQEAYIAARGAQLPDQRPNIPDAKGYIALTFDDGPTGGVDGLTVKLLDGLKARGAHATFFMCGYRVRDFHTHMERYLAEGHELGNHTMDHPLKLSKLPAEEIYDQVDSNNTLIASYTGQPATVMRPVGGAVSDTLQEQMKKLGMPIINWSVDTLDWKYRDAARIKKVIVEQARDGDIVLMHDLHQPTVEGALAAIDELQKEGYAFVTVQELAQIKGVKLEPGVVYTNIQNT